MEKTLQKISNKKILFSVVQSQIPINHNTSTTESIPEEFYHQNFKIAGG